MDEKFETHDNNISSREHLSDDKRSNGDNRKAQSERIDRQRVRRPEIRKITLNHSPSENDSHNEAPSLLSHVDDPAQGNNVELEDDVFGEDFLFDEDNISTQNDDLPEDDEESQHDNTDCETASAKRRNRIIQTALLVLAIVCLVAGIYLFIKPKIEHRNQETAEEALHSQLKEQINYQAENAPKEPLQLNAVITIRRGEVEDDNSFGSGADYILRPGETLDPNLPPPTQPPLDKDKVVEVRTDSIMLIPYIHLEVAIGTNVDRTTLAIVPGHFPGTPKPGEVGISTYFGHNWIYKKDRHFSRLREVPVGETIEMKYAGKSYTYRIDFSEDITPDKIGHYVYKYTDQARILLVTCYRPDGSTTGSAPYRAVVGGYLESVKPLK